jgi:glutamate dehydrogenase (NAD(P)+)
MQMLNVTKIPEDPLFTCEVKIPEFDITGWLCIHSIGQRGACGGIRLYPDVTKEEIELLAKAMTYKYCFCEYALGGAKAGITIPFDACEQKRNAMLQKFGEHIGPLIRERIYYPWTDMNCSAADLKSVYTGAGKQLKVMPGDSAYYTALSTFSSLLAVADYYKIPSQQCKVTIEGFGNVGKNLAREIVQWGAKIVGVSNRHGAVFNEKGLDLEEVAQSQERFGDDWVSQKGNWGKIAKEELTSLRMDIHVPCARTYLLNEEKAQTIGCKAVVPAANAPCTVKAEEILFQKGITVLPDFAVNIGGIIGSGLDSLGATDDQIRDLFLEDHYKMILRLLELRERSNISVVEIASTEAGKHYEHIAISRAQRKKPTRGLMRMLAKQIKPSQRQLLRLKLHDLKSTFNNRFTCAS